MPTYVVTGTSGGIGLEIVKQLAARGDKVYATVRKKERSSDGVDEISTVAGDVTIVEGVDVMSDDVGVVLKEKLAGVSIDVLIHNAGGYVGAGFRDHSGSENFASQKFDQVTPELMLSTFNLNSVSVLRVQQALHSQMVAPGGKVVVISTGMGSIGDNGSGGVYAYRTSKAAVNMITKGMSCDFKEQGIAVCCLNPGFVVSDFANMGAEGMKKMGAIPTETSVNGILKVSDRLTMETTGSYMQAVPKGDDGEILDPRPFPPGW